MTTRATLRTPPLLCVFVAIAAITATLFWAGSDRISRSGADRDPTTLAWGDPAPPVADADDPTILFFYDGHCPDCTQVKEALLEPFASRMGLTLADVSWKDVTRPEVALEVLDLERRIGFEAQALAPILVSRGKAHCGLVEIRRFVNAEAE